MTTPKHICFTCEDFICSCALVSQNTSEAYLIGDCIHYCGKNAGERKTCKIYKRADEKRIKDREKLIEDTKKRYEV